MGAGLTGGGRKDAGLAHDASRPSSPRSSTAMRRPRQASSKAIDRPTTPPPTIKNSFIRERSPGRRSPIGKMREVGFDELIRVR